MARIEAVTGATECGDLTAPVPWSAVSEGHATRRSCIGLPAEELLGERREQPGLVLAHGPARLDDQVPVNVVPHEPDDEVRRAVHTQIRPQAAKLGGRITMASWPARRPAPSLNLRLLAAPPFRS
jgi:hypothetical protein